MYKISWDTLFYLYVQLLATIFVLSLASKWNTIRISPVELPDPENKRGYHHWIVVSVGHKICDIDNFISTSMQLLAAIVNLRWYQIVFVLIHRVARSIQHGQAYNRLNIGSIGWSLSLSSSYSWTQPLKCRLYFNYNVRYEIFPFQRSPSLICDYRSNLPVSIHSKR